MAKSLFGPRTAVFGVVVNVVGIIGAAAPVVPSSFGLGLLQFLAPPLIGAWFINVGLKLYRHTEQFASLDGTAHSSGST